MYNAPSFLIEAGWREDLQLSVIVMLAAAVIAVIGEAFVCLTKPNSKLGDVFVPVMVTALGVFVSAAGVLGYQVAKTPFNDAYWKTYTVTGTVLAADNAQISTGGQVPMAVLDVPLPSGAGIAFNMSDNSLAEMVGQEVSLTCHLVQTDNGAMDNICSFVGLSLEAAA
jgi:hypothetical protein